MNTSMLPPKPVDIFLHATPGEWSRYRICGDEWAPIAWIGEDAPEGFQRYPRVTAPWQRLPECWMEAMQ